MMGCACTAAPEGFHNLRRATVDGHLTLDVLLAKQRGKPDTERNESIIQHLQACEHCRKRNEVVSHIGKLLDANGHRRSARDKAGECPDYDTIRSYGEGRLFFFRKRKVESHLTDCGECRRDLIAIAVAPTGVAKLEQITEEEKALLQSLPPIFPAERFTQIQARLRRLAPEPPRRYKYSERWWEKLVLRPVFRAHPILAPVAVAVLLVGLFLGWDRAAEWRSNVWAQRGMDWLVGEQQLTEGELRPSGDFKFTLFGKRRGAGQAAESRNPADDLFQKSLGWNPNHRQARHGLALAAYFDGRWARADSLLRLLLAENSREARVWNDLAVVMYRRGDVASARELFARALQLQPDFAEAVFNLAILFEENGQINQARRAWEKYLAIDRTGKWADVARAHLANEPLP
jgi:tetratricopeptide (TPR) repeat protein